MSIPYEFNPLGISGNKKQPLEIPFTITAESDGEYAIVKNGSPSSNNLEYSLDGGKSWNSYTIGQSISVPAGGTLSFQGNTFAFSSLTSNYYKITATANFKISGNLNSLIGWNNDNVGEYFFNRLFYKNTYLIDASELLLPATFLRHLQGGIGRYCYYQMFNGCTALMYAPKELPATFVGSGTGIIDSASYAYASMFNGCASLITAPAILSKKIPYSGCDSMFYGCKSLTTAPQLPAITLASRCYYNMFYNCTSLNTAPSILPATTLESYCYQRMFYKCTSLIEAPEIMGEDLSLETCYGACNMMFQGCTKLEKLKVHFKEWAVYENTSYHPTYEWLFDVSPDGTFVKPPELPETRGSSYIPSGWTIEQN